MFLQKTSVRSGVIAPRCFLAGILAVLATVNSASAVPFYVRSIATAQTSGNIPDSHTSTNDTGQVQTLSNSSGPFHVHSSGAFYDFDATANVLTEIGQVHGSATIAVSSTGPAGGANATAQGQWSDTITITSDTLQSGTPVSFLATILLHRTITGAPPATASAFVNGPFGLSLTDSLASPNATESVSTIISTTIGQVLTATSTLTLSAGGGGIAPFGMSGSAFAENTAVFHLVPITPGASYSTASGVTFVPEPASVWGMLSGIALLGLSRARVWRARARDNR
jgi:hypothetical protein